MNKMRELWFCLSNDLIGLTIVEDADLLGYRLVDPISGYTMYTAYVAEDGFSSYVAIPNIHKGIDCEDEKPLREKAPLFSAVSAIKTHHMQHGGNYPNPIPVNSHPWISEQPKS